MAEHQTHNLPFPSGCASVEGLAAEQLARHAEITLKIVLLNMNKTYFFKVPIIIFFFLNNKNESREFPIKYVCMYVTLHTFLNSFYHFYT